MNKIDNTNDPLYISIIDDDHVLRELLQKVIQMIDIKDFELDFEEFPNGIEFFESERVNLSGKHIILLDGVMPVMDGLEVLQQLKKMDTSERIHVLMLSARKGEEHTSRALRLGAAAYITKPFSIKDLQRTVLEIIKRMKINASE
jgi:two-component system, cell cycle response regulator